MTENGIAVSRHDRLFLLAHLEGQTDPVQFTADALARQGAQVARDGRALTREAEVIEVLRSRHARFVGDVLPLLVNLKVVPDAAL